MKGLRDWWPILVGILLAGLWLGALSQRVTELERRQRFEHGAYELPMGVQ